MKKNDVIAGIVGGTIFVVGCTVGLFGYLKMQEPRFRGSTKEMVSTDADNSDFSSMITNKNIFAGVSDEGVYTISMDDEFAAFFNNSDNIGKPVQMEAGVFSVRDGMSNENDIEFTTLWSINNEFCGTQTSGVNLREGDEVVYQGVFTGEFRDITNELTGKALKAPVLETKSVSVIGNAKPLSDNPNEVVGNEDYERIAIKDAGEFRQFETDPNMDGVEAIFKVQVITNQPNTNVSMFHIAGRDEPIYGSGAIDDTSIKTYDWVYLDAIFSNNLPSPPFSGNDKGFLVQRAIKIQ